MSSEILTLKVIIIILLYYCELIKKKEKSNVYAFIGEKRVT